MFQAIRTRKKIGVLLMLGALSLAPVWGWGMVAQAQDDLSYIGEVRTFDPEFPLPHAASLAYSPLADAFMLLTAPTNLPPGEEAHNLTMISSFEDLLGSTGVPAVNDPINMAFDSKANRLILFDPAGQEWIAIQADPDGYLDPVAITRFAAGALGVQDPQGIAADPVTGALFLLDGAGPLMIRIAPDMQGSLDGEAALAEGRVSWIDLSGLGLGAVRGLAFDPADGHIHTMNPDQLSLYELSSAGQLIATRDMTVLELGFRDPQGFVFAPSADLTDDPAQMHLYLVDSGLGPLSTDTKNEENGYHPTGTPPCLRDELQVNRPPAEQGPGRIFELTLTQPVAYPYPIEP